MCEGVRGTVGVITVFVEKNPSIKVHRVTDPPLFFFKSKFNFSQTVGEMVFVSFEV